ncbi:MAG: STAS domain-containing protein [Phycisphaeraceae bacterium]
MPPTERWSDDIWIVRLQNEPAFSDELHPLLQRIGRDDVPPSIVIDLAEVTRINSSNLSQLLKLRKSATDHNVQLRVTSPSNAVWSVFLMTGLDKVFQFTQDTATALAELQLDE